MAIHENRNVWGFIMAPEKHPNRHLWGVSLRISDPFAAGVSRFRRENALGPIIFEVEHNNSFLEHPGVPKRRDFQIKAYYDM